MSTIRAFLAISLNPEVRSSLESFQKQVKGLLPPIKWVNPQSLHVTVKFLGDVEENRLEPLHRTIESVVQEFSSFSLQIEGIGGFPHLRAPRVLWAGISGQVEELHMLVLHVEEALALLDFPMETKPFHSHLTLARIRENSRDVGVALSQSNALAPQKFFGKLNVTQLSLFRSELKPTGAIYHRLWDVSLVIPVPS